MKRVWNPSGDFSFKPMGSNVGIFIFSKISDKNRVLEGGPWSFDRHLVVLKNFDGDNDFDSASFSSCRFWVQIHKLPLNLMTSSTAEIIGNQLGHFISHEADVDGIAWGRFMRIWVDLDISKPLRRVLTLSSAGLSARAILKYERLPIFCFHCGILGHVDKECEDRLAIPVQDRKDFQYGDWIRAGLSAPSSLPRSSPSLRKQSFDSSSPDPNSHTSSTPPSSVPLDNLSLNPQTTSLPSILSHPIYTSTSIISFPPSMPFPAPSHLSQSHQDSGPATSPDIIMCQAPSPPGLPSAPVSAPCLPPNITPLSSPFLTTIPLQIASPAARILKRYFKQKSKPPSKQSTLKYKSGPSKRKLAYPSGLIDESSDEPSPEPPHKLLRSLSASSDFSSVSSLLAVSDPALSAPPPSLASSDLATAAAMGLMIPSCRAL